MPSVLYLMDFCGLHLKLVANILSSVFVCVPENADLPNENIHRNVNVGVGGRRMAGVMKMLSVHVMGL